MQLIGLGQVRGANFKKGGAPRLTQLLEALSIVAFPSASLACCFSFCIALQARLCALWSCCRGCAHTGLAPVGGVVDGAVGVAWGGLVAWAGRGEGCGCDCNQCALLVPLILWPQLEPSSS
jgi:hypothetical protein